MALDLCFKIIIPVTDMHGMMDALLELGEKRFYINKDVPFDSMLENGNDAAVCGVLAECLILWLEVADCIDNLELVQK